LKPASQAATVCFNAGDVNVKWLRGFLAGVLLLVLASASALWTYRVLVLPKTEGELTVAGLSAPVSITRDAHGIPTIKAQSMEDLMFALGFVHAQDRLWQLEVHRRIGRGQVAEAFGQAAVETDQFLRALGVRRVAEQQWAAVGGETRKVVEAYAAGINTFIEQHMDARPPEFIVLGLQPGRWEPADTLAWTTMMAWDLGGNWNAELIRMRLALNLPVDRINELMPPYPGEQPLPLADYAALYRELQVDGRLGQQALNAAPPSGIEGQGSNNWVVSGARSETGHPLLANDPHLKLSAPALWYLARLEAPGFKVAGATMPGLPVVVLGQNEHIAWGFTNTGPDVQDLYLEQIKPDDPSQYRTPDGWAAFETHEEVIKVRGQPDVKMTVRATRHGPVISDANTQATLGLTGPAAAPRYVLALRWTALDVPNTSMEAALAMNRATSVQAFIDAASLNVAPMQNMVVADREGRIGWVAAGSVPLRSADNDLKGQVPAPGWEARYDWIGYLDPAQTPRDMDPPRGWIATANQRIHGPDYPHYLGSEWALPYRQHRIEALLEAQPKHSLNSFAKMQADELSLATLKLLPVLRSARSDHRLAGTIQAWLRDFDGTMAAERPEPLVFWSWVRHLTEGLLADEVGPDFLQRTLVGSRNFRDAVEGILERNDAWWCDDKRTPELSESCQQQVDAALTRALEELEALQGPDPSKWQWGNAHVARAEHRPFSRVKALSPLFELRTPVGGDTYTVNVARVNLRADSTTGERYLNEHGPSLRALYDLKDPSQSRIMHSSGQSGIPLSRHYHDFLPRWAAVDYVPVWMPAGQGGATLTLRPAR
jgi:penicillin amidase